MQPHFSPETLENSVVFEGLDGAGSSTQARRLVERLHREGHPALLTSEPTGGPVGALIRMILRGRLRAAGNSAQTDRQLAHLFAADRFDHLYNEVDGIARQAQSGTIAVSARYYFSSYAYNARSEADFDLVDRLNRDFPLPQLVIYLRVPMELSLGRLKRRQLRELYEKEEELRRVEENYNLLFAPIRDRVLEFTTEGNLNETAEQIWDAVRARLFREG
jgi:dTMP kinase